MPSRRKGTGGINKGVTSGIRRPKPQKPKAEKPQSSKRSFFQTEAPKKSAAAKDIKKQEEQNRRAFDVRLSYREPSSVASSLDDSTTSQSDSGSPSNSPTASNSPPANIDAESANTSSVYNSNGVEEMIRDFYGESSIQKTPDKKRKKFFKRSTPKKATVRLHGDLEIHCRTKASPKKARSPSKKRQDTENVAEESCTPPGADADPPSLSPLRMTSTGISQRKSHITKEVRLSGIDWTSESSSSQETKSSSSSPEKEAERLLDVEIGAAKNDNMLEVVTPVKRRMSEIEGKVRKSPRLNSATATDDSNAASPPRRLFPLFEGMYGKGATEKCEKKVRPQQTRAELVKGLVSAKDKSGLHQMVIEAGQSVENAAKECKVCGTVYTPTDRDDVLVHAERHEKVLGRNPALLFSGFKRERVLTVHTSLPAGRISLILPNDPANHWKRAIEAVEVCNLEIGWAEDVGRAIATRPVTSNGDSRQVYLYIFEKKIIGVLLAEEIDSAYRLKPQTNEITHMQREESKERAVCGISRLWVSEVYRGLGIGSRLVDALRQFFCDPSGNGRFLEKDSVALTAPTEAGWRFGTKVLGERFKVYMVD